MYDVWWQVALSCAASTSAIQGQHSVVVGEGQCQRRVLNCCTVPHAPRLPMTKNYSTANNYSITVMSILVNSV